VRWVCHALHCLSFMYFSFKAHYQVVRNECLLNRRPWKAFSLSFFCLSSLFLLRLIQGRPDSTQACQRRTCVEIADLIFYRLYADVLTLPTVSKLWKIIKGIKHWETVFVLQPRCRDSSALRPGLKWLYYYFRHRMRSCQAPSSTGNIVIVVHFYSICLICGLFV